MQVEIGEIVLFYDAIFQDSDRGRAAMIVGEHQDDGYVNLAMFPDADQDVRDSRMMPIVPRVRVRVVRVLPPNWRSSGPYAVVRASGLFEDYEIPVDKDARHKPAEALPTDPPATDDATDPPAEETPAPPDNQNHDAMQVEAINQLASYPSWNRNIVEQFEDDKFSIVFDKGVLKITNKHSIQIAGLRYRVPEETRGYELSTQRGKQLRPHLRMQRDADQVLSMILLLSKIMEATKDSESPSSVVRKTKAVILSVRPKE